MRYGRRTHLDDDFLLQNMMGPNSVLLLEELIQDIRLQPGARVLDLGCGKGLTSVFLGTEFQAQIFATDLWVDASENFQRFREFGLEDCVIPIHAEAHNLPYARGYFDAVVSVDAWHYFGADPKFLDEHIVPLVRPGGTIAVSVPGLKRDLVNDEVPEELKPWWQENMNFYSKEWWRELWEQSPNITVTKCFSQPGHEKAWSDWLRSPNPYAQLDAAMMKAEGGKYFDTIGIVAVVKWRTSWSAPPVRVATATF
ncbi:MAG: Demethylrebeccamycin-D-glucose O-methyltransferase [Firmicutes bacterium ADurb.Bin506]|jgi:cyclopropane fatty-acyl-phospholipid synthase-like methyltransferase|nr:MAG: Demethylrebeccamycin-D-glucose O-methyltransferase [Firmicutes bacterium ADurb.Bin506]